MTNPVQWRVLPTKANQQMEQAGADAAGEFFKRTGSNNLWVIYEAMVAAAPKPPASTEPVVVALVAEDRHQLTDVIQCDGIHSLPVGTQLIDRAAYDLARAEVLELMAELAKAKRLLHSASVHLSRWVGMDEEPRQQIIEYLEGIESPVERDELRPCPFCGSQVTLLTGPEDILITGAHGKACPFLDLDVIVDSRDAWQTRAALESKP